MEQENKKKYKFPSAYTVLLAIMIIIALITQIVPRVKSAKLSDLIMAPVTGIIGIADLDKDEAISTAMESGGIDATLDTINTFDDNLISVWNTGELRGAIDVALFVLIIGGFLGVVTKTGALDAGIGYLVKKLKGKELMLIPILMVIFSIGGSTYGMAEESLAFYALLTATMMAAGFDPIVAAATVLLGSGTGVLGSTVNPFAIGAAVSAAESVGVTINQGTVILLGFVLWMVTLIVSILYVMKYAKKVRENKENTLLSKSEIEAATKEFSKKEDDIVHLDGKKKIVLILFALSFVVMIMSVIPWEDFGVMIFENTAFLTGAPLGTWWFPELTVWFFLMAVIIGLVYRMEEENIVGAFILGCADMVGVALVIGISRGISFMMANSGLDLFILDKASNLLSGVSSMLFANMSYVIYMGLSFLIPSTSGLASVSMPIFAPLAERLTISPELIVAAFSAGCGIVNLVTPTSGVVMGGLAISKVEYSSWLKFVTKVLLYIFLSTVVVLIVVPMLLGL